MALSNNDRIGRTLELLNEALRPYIQREMEAVHKQQWRHQALQGVRDNRAMSNDIGDWDTQTLLSVMLNEWNTVFRYALGSAERSLVHEIKDVRNSWAHQNTFSTDDAERGLDSIRRLLQAISAPQAQEVERLRNELLRRRFEEQARHERRKASSVAVEGTPSAGFKPWREVVTPHPDVASGRFQVAEFAADLGQVHRGEAAGEYQDPHSFFARTYVTEGLRQLLANGVRRLANGDGDPVIELQTGFGGGKTHSMLALYHLFSGTATRQLPGVESVLEAAGGAEPPRANRAVLVGTALSVSEPRSKDDGTITHTLWGEIAHQLLGADGYALVAEADRQGVSPGSDALRELFRRAAPCLILIDEWVAFLRNVYKVEGLPAGGFEQNLSFAQSLTEAVRAVPKALLVASIPASQIEIGGEGGERALERIRHTFGRMESPWRPATVEESFEIVRRRLFEPVSPENAPTRDAVSRAFCQLYREQSGDFPTACHEGEYERRIRGAYPIHPELFDRLFNDWSALENFQRTRGVLRLMAKVIHHLWERDDRSLLILPAHVPLDEPQVQSELTRYLPDHWVPVIETDVDGPQSLPLTQDRENANLGRYSASRRVARTLFMGSAPRLHSANKGIDDRQIKLGCVQPGESVATFGDALRRLTEKATYLYADGTRYWYSTQPSVAQIARDRAARLGEDEVHQEIRQRLRKEANTRGDFSRVHSLPQASGDVPDEREARLVILDPTHAHVANTDSSPARVEASDILEHRGPSPRIYRNTLAFLAPDRARLEELEQAVRRFLAWQSVEDDHEELNLDAFGRSQARTQRQREDDTVRARIPETYIWLLVPQQPQKTGSIEWNQVRVQGGDALAVRAAKRMRNDETLITRYGGIVLRKELDEIPLWRGNHVSLRQLTEDYATYPYLPRLRDEDVLLDAVQDGVGQLSWQSDSFAYAQSWDEDAQRYRGLKAGENASVVLDSASVVVKPEIAARQLEADRRKAEAPTDETYGGGGGATGGVGEGGEEGTEDGGVVAPPAPPQRFYGSVSLDPMRLARDAGEIAQEVVQHLAALVGADVQVTLDIRASVPGGVPDDVVRTVTENSRTLKFGSFDFERE